MARMKQTPVKTAKSSRNNRIKERRKAAKRGTTDLGSDRTNKKRQRSRADKSIKPLPAKRKIMSKVDTDYLPPELRQAGLLAHQSIAQGKCFGPFRGQFDRSGRKDIEDHAFVSKITGVDKLVYYFYVHNHDQEKCMWLQRLQSAPSKKQQNMVAYKSAVGVCYEAMCDISPGQELLVLYDDTYGGKKYPAYVENIPIHFVSPSRQLQVVPLDDTNTEVLSAQNHGEMMDGQSAATTSDDQEENYGVDDGDDDDDNDGDYDDDDDVDYDAGDDDDDYDEVDDVKDSDYSDEDTIKKKVHKDAKPKENKVKKKRPLVVKEIVLQIYELKTVNLDDNTESMKYLCSHCAVVHPNKEAADQHMASKACKDQVFKCEECQVSLENNVMKALHKCNTIHKCTVCDMEFSSSRLLKSHTKDTTDDLNHRPGCVECACSFRTVKDKMTHLVDKHPKDTFNCPVCLKTYTNLSYLKEHIKSHIIGAFKCAECHKQFSSKSNLRKHIHKHSKGYKPALDKRKDNNAIKKHPCELCGKRFESPRSLEVHMRSHTGERPYECNLCTWKFSQKSHLRRHMHIVHEDGKLMAKAEQPKTCEICNKVYANTRVLRVHIQSIHNKERPHKCSHCDSTFSQRGHLWRHKHTVHPDCEEVQKKIKESGFVCKIEECKKAFPCQSDLLNHENIVHQSNWPFTCDKCDGRGFANRSNLSKHMKRQHANEEELQTPLICETCSKEFNSMYKLSQHKRTHTGEKEFKCDLCGAMFVQKSGLNKHIRCRRCPKIEGSPIRQVSNFKYECEQCSKMFPGPADLKAHLRTHTGERPFECEHCQKKFNQSGNLAKHIKYIHQKVQRPKEKPREKKFFCSLCGKAFSCPSSLAMHCRIHSGTKPFQCDKCDNVAFAQQGNLKKHMKRWHEADTTAPTKRRRKKKRTEAVRDSTANEGLEQSEVTMETGVDSEAEKTTAENEESNAGHSSEEALDHSNPTAIVERSKAEQTAIASILTSINTDPSLVNPRGFTPLNTPSHGFFISSLAAAPSTVGPSVIMNNLGASASGQIQIPLSNNTIEVSTNSFTRTNQVFVPPQLSAFVSPTATVPHTTAPGSSDGTSTSTAILPHVNTILSPQLNPANYISHSNQVPEMTYPFSPSSLFQH